MVHSYKNLLVIIFLSVATFNHLQAQQAVAIGDTGVKSNAVLYLKGNGTQGLIIPIVNNTGSFGEAGMLVFNKTDNKVYYHNGTDWVGAGGGSASAEVDGIVGNEVTQVITDRGLIIKGSGTTADPKIVGIIDGTVEGQVLQWNQSLIKWELKVLTGSAPYTAGPGIDITGTTISNKGDLDATDDITTTSLTSLGDISGTFSNLKVAKINGINVAAGSPAVNDVLQYNGTSWSPAALTSGGTVTSAALTLPPIFNVTGSPITTTGTFAATLNSQTSSTVFAAPIGASGAPSFRTLAPVDIPIIPPTKISGAGAGVKAILGSDNNTVSWVSGAPDQLLGTDPAGALKFVNKSSFAFTNVNVIPKGSAAGLVASNIFDNGTNIGIGNTSPTAALHVTPNSNTFAIRIDQSGGGHGLLSYVNSTSASDIVFSASSLSGGGVNVLGNGHMGVGIGNPTYTLHVGHGNAGPSGGDAFTVQNTAGTHAWSLFVSNGSGNLAIYKNNNLRGQFDQTNGTYTAVSDRRLKKNIATIENVLPKINDMQIRRYHFKDQNENEPTNIGVIAQELKEVFPELVKYLKDDDKFTVDYSSMATLAIKAIQEQQIIIDSLKLQVINLENGLKKQEQVNNTLNNKIEAFAEDLEYIKRNAGLDKKAKK